MLWKVDLEKKKASDAQRPNIGEICGKASFCTLPINYCLMLDDIGFAH